MFLSLRQLHDTIMFVVSALLWMFVILLGLAIIWIVLKCVYRQVKLMQSPHFLCSRHLAYIWHLTSTCLHEYKCSYLCDVIDVAFIFWSVSVLSSFQARWLWQVPAQIRVAWSEGCQYQPNQTGEECIIKAVFVILLVQHRAWMHDCAA